MPPKLGLYSIADTPEELLSKGYGLYSTEFGTDPTFGELQYNTSFNPAPYTGPFPFQNVFRINEGVSGNYVNPSPYGISSYRDTGGIMDIEPQQNFEFLTSAYEDDDEEQVEYLPNQEPKGIGKLLDVLRKIPTPMNLLRGGLESLRSLNNRIQQSDFVQATSLADYLDMRKYGGAQGRRDAAARNMAQARGLQKKIDRGEFNRDTSGITDRGRGNYGNTGGGNIQGNISTGGTDDTAGTPF